MLLTCSMSYCESDIYVEEYPLRGVKIDSIMVAVDDIRTINEKLIEGEINSKKIHHYELQVESYETLVNELNNRIETMKVDIDKKDIQLNKEKKQKKFFIKTSVGAGIVAILFILI